MRRAWLTWLIVAGCSGSGGNGASPPETPPPETTPEPERETPPDPQPEAPPVAVPERTDPPVQAGDVVPTAISVGPGHACARMSDDTARCWSIGEDDNDYGELGGGAQGPSARPVRIAPQQGVVEIGTGLHYTCIRLRDRSVRCVGWNPYGQLGNGRSEGHEVEWQRVAGVEGAVDLAVADGFVCAVVADGTVRCWGRNDNGELGDGTSEARTAPVRVRGLDGVVALEVDDFACARRVDGSVHCWGGNQTETASAIPALQGATEVAVDSLSGAAVMPDGTIRTWGQNHSAQLGIDPYPEGEPHSDRLSYRAEPEVVPGLTGVRSVAVGGTHMCALLEGGRVVCWGAEWGHPAFPAACMRDTRNRSGGGSARQWRYCPAPTPVRLNGVVEIDADGETTCVRTDGGSVRCWSPLGGPVAL